MCDLPQCVLTQTTCILWPSPPHLLSHSITPPYNDDLITKCQECHLLPPSPIVHDGIKEYEVKKILDSQIFHRKVEYLYIGKVMVLKKMSGNPPKMYEVPNS